MIIATGMIITAIINLPLLVQHRHHQHYHGYHNSEGDNYDARGDNDGADAHADVVVVDDDDDDDEEEEEEEEGDKENH